MSRLDFFLTRNKPSILIDRRQQGQIVRLQNRAVDGDVAEQAGPVVDCKLREDVASKLLVVRNAELFVGLTIFRTFCFHFKSII